MSREELFININELPNVLSKKETSELILKAQDGDKEALNVLTKHNIKLVVYIMNCYFANYNYEKKDLVSVGCIGLVKAILNFDLTKNSELSTCAAIYIKNEIWHFINQNKKYQNVISFDSVININSINSKCWKLESTIRSDYDISEEYETREIREKIRDIINKLPERDREIILLFFGFYDDKIYSQNEIAKIFNITSVRVSQIIRRNLTKIGIMLKEMDLIDLKKDWQLTRLHS